MTEYPLTFNLTVSLHPDGEQELTAWGNSNVNVPLLQSFLAWHNITTRKTSYQLYIPVKPSTLATPDWNVLIPELKALLEYIAKTQNQSLEFSFQQTDNTSCYDHDMQFVFAQDTDWLYFITPAVVDEDLYGTDHGMYEHQIIKVPDIFQASFIERFLSKWDIPYEKLHHMSQEGFKVHAKQANLWVYGGMEGFQKKFREEVERIFQLYALAHPGSKTAKLNWTTGTIHI